MKTLRFGIEIETVGLGREKLARAIQGVVGGTVSFDGRSWQVTDTQGRTWSAVPDASLSGVENGEVVSPPLSYNDLETLQQVVRALRNAGARVDASTSIHLHVDGSRFDARSLTNLVKLVYKQERLLEAALGVSPARLGRYCRPIDEEFMRRLEAKPPRTLQEMSEAWYGYANARPSRYDSSRYRGLNLNSFHFRGTLEFRSFEGTLHAGEVKAYIQLVLALAAKALTSKAASSRRRTQTAGGTKYAFRTFLIRLGLVGEEFKTARHHLLKRLEGSAAWPGERRDRAARATPAAAEVEASGGPAAVAA